MFQESPRTEADEPPPNRLYAEQRAEAIRFHAGRRMSRKTLETIYGKTAVQQVLG